ncbi:T9SS type B sorting domain-containing protein [Moheibacter sediminis]|uniref:Gliding motility-associated C-terminal domain-containing protein n=1 Tax=Moheibacter sediminis TaxID=1434700 RepID=A0A1W1YM96_9FLAO|nr:T9SS type B sorting domain-containing protein [Moheibacter sediminis]SMC37360.1 gliding motility-associated C-terminal domain-containing protein [Moheibacter sediminis]
MKRTLFFFIFITSYQYAFAQLESSHWYFGAHSGLDFSSGSPQVVYNGQLDTGEGCASISDINGNLLFYTDGTTVFNRNHQQLNTVNLKGDSSSTQSAIIVPYPGNTDLYYIFTVDADDGAQPGSTTNEGFHFYLVDMTLNGGLGGMVDTPNNNLLPLTSEKVTAVAHKNNDDIWVITHFEDKFYSYLVTSTGLNTTPVVSQIGPYIDPLVYPVNSRGYIKAAPNGKKIAIAHLSNLPLSELGGNVPNSTFANTYDGHAALYDFDDQTGLVSNEIVISDEGSPYGVEFSFDSKFAYFEFDYHDENYNWTNGELAQYDLSATDIPASKLVIFDDFIFNGGSFQARGALQLALDNKIYYSHTYYTFNAWGIVYLGDYLSIIHSPHLQGAASNFEYNALRLNDAANPNHKASYGLPPFITSFFNAVIVFDGGISGSEACLGEALNFSVIANSPVLNILWDFGDGNTSNLLAPSHTYSNPGTYTVSATVTTDEETVPVTRQVTIHSLPNVQDVELVKCDYDGDGLALFEIYDADNLVSGDSNITITYHESPEDAISGEDNLPNVYTNTSNPQIIYVRVENEFGCLSFSELELSTSLNTIQIVPDIELCDENSDGVETFNLTQNQNIINSLYTDPITILSYHKTITEAEFGLNPLNLNYTNNSNPETIYARVETDSCFEVIAFDLILNPLPFINIEDNTICPQNGIITLDAGTGFTTYLWEGMQGNDLNQPNNEPTITITQPGSYFITVWDDKGCQFRDSFTITNSVNPVISEIIISESGTVEIIAIGEFPFEYSLNNVLWQSSNQFTNLPPGDYIAYVRDSKGCISDTKGFGILEIPNFISPNGDGYNDTWSIRGISNYEDVHIQIFDRNGKLFVDRMNHNNSEVWDGKYLGRTVHTGTYWYIIKTTDGRKYVGTLAVRNY